MKLEELNSGQERVILYDAETHNPHITNATNEGCERMFLPPHHQQPHHQMNLTATHHNGFALNITPALRLERRRGKRCLLPLTLSEVSMELVMAVGRGLSTEAAVVYLMDWYDFDLSHLHRALKSKVFSPSCIM